MQEAQVNIGASVITADGQSVGRVIAARAQEFIVEGGIFIKYICSYQYADVTSATPDHVELRLDTLALEQPWNVTDWRDPHGIEHHIRQVGVPMPATPMMGQDTENHPSI